MQEVINRISAELGIHPDVVEKAVRSQFEFTKETMESGELRPVQLQYFGKIAVKPSRLEKLGKTHLLNNNPAE